MDFFISLSFTTINFSLKMGFFPSLFTFQCLIIICFIDKSSQSGKATFARVVLNKPDRQLLPEKNLVANLKNESFIASSVWKEIVEFEPHQARMKQMDDPNLLGHAWCPKQMIKSSPEEWIEIDLGDLKMIKNLATAGRGDGNFAEYAPHFYLDYQRVSGKWIRYRNQRKEQLLNGNTDARNVAMTNFESMIIARRIRIYPISKEKQIRACMRIIIYGCDFDDGVVEYSVSQGHYYTARNGNEKYDLRDLTYDGVISIDKSNPKGLLEEGLGQLMDNVIYNGVISEDHNNKIRGYHFVGWNRKFLDSNKVEIVMKFDQMRSVKQIRFYAMNMIPEDIGVFSSAIIHFSRGGVYYDRISPAYQFKTVIDTRVYYPRWINITLQNVLARFLKIDLFFEVDWIILSEIVIISEKSNEIIPKESESIQTNSPITHNITSVKYIPTDSTATVLIPQNGKNNQIDTNRSSSFTASSSLGLIATISSCFLGFVFLIALIVFGVFTLRRHKKRIKGKLRNPIYQTRINGGPFIGDSVVVPLTGGTQSSSGTGSFYYKYPGNVELGLTYPVMGKEYMTLSSKSGTDYDMAGGNSLDGLIPTGTRDIKYNGMNSYAPPMGQNDSPYPTNIYSRNSADGSTGGSSNTDYASTSLYHFSQVFENGSNFYPYNQQNVGMNSFALHKMNPSVMSSLSGSPFKVQSPTPSTQILPPNQLMDMFSHYSPYRQISHLSQFSPTHSTSSRFLMPSNADLYPTSYVVPVNNFQTDQSVIMTNSMPSLQGISGNSVMVATNDAFQQPPSNSVTLKKLLSNLKEFHQEQIGHVSVIGKGENGTVGYISIAQNISTEHSKTTVISKSFLYRSLNNYNSKDVKYETMKELELLCGIKHSVFLPLTAYVLDEQNSMSVHQTALCFLFEFDEPLENLHTFLNQHAVNKAAILNLPRGPTLYSQSISNISANSSFNTRHLYPSVSSLLFIITQIARGMSYLESRQIIHRDLAARNCLIGQNLKIKITDIAMSIQKFKEHYIECAVVGIQKNEDCDSNSSISVVKRFYPLQWMAFESILQATYSCKTDIWSFGVTMWEILHRCQQTPYGGFAISFDRIRDNAYNLSIGNSSAVFPNENLYPHQSQSNFRPSQHMANPSSSILHENLGLSRDFSDLIQECWNRNPHQRPTFKLISSILEQKITNFEFANDHSNLFSTINNSETY